MGITDKLQEFPFIAILRGITTAEIPEAGFILKDAGFKIIEVPLNSPTPYDSIRYLNDSLGSEVLTGAGTVLHTAEVDQVAAAGGRLIVSPNCNIEVISYAKSLGLICFPGVATPTEAISALDAGADALKVFPAELVSPRAMKAMKAILPPGTLMIPVGGIDASNWQEFGSVGAAGYGLGSSLYKAGMAMSQLKENADRFMVSLNTKSPL